MTRDKPAPPPGPESINVLVTRPGPAGKSLTQALRDQGAEVSWQPAISKTPNPGGRRRFLEEIKNADLLLITSPEVLEILGEQQAAAIKIPCAIVGQASAERWRQNQAKAIAKAATLRGLHSLLLSERILDAHPRVLWPRGNLYQADLAEKLRASCNLTEIEFYATHNAYLDRELDIDPTQDNTLIHFASPSAVQAFTAALVRQGAEDRRANWIAQTIGPTTAAALKPKEWRALRIAKSPNEDHQLEALLA
ncbi:MAG: uroporphyrinogen-III synthase [Planctomycetota bacterium]